MSDGPDGFAGIKWGSSVEELQKLFDVYRYVNDPELKIYRAKTAFDQIPVIADFAFLHGGFVGVRLSFEPQYYQEMAGALKARFGSPGTESADKAGWIGDQSSVYLIQHADDGSVARIETKQLTDYYSARLKERAKAKN